MPRRGPQEIEEEIEALQARQRQLVGRDTAEWMRVRSRLLQLMLERTRWEPEITAFQGDLALLHREALRDDDGYLRRVEDVESELL